MFRRLLPNPSRIVTLYKAPFGNLPNIVGNAKSWSQSNILTNQIRSYISLTSMRPTVPLNKPILSGENQIIKRNMNRNARRPKKANHGKRPVCNARRRAKRFILRSRAYREKIFGFW